MTSTKTTDEVRCPRAWGKFLVLSSFLMLGGAGFTTLAAGDADSALPAGAGVPPVAVTTNDQGVTLNRFSTRPVVTNLPAASNDLVRIQKRTAAIEAELRQIEERENRVRPALRDNNLTMAGYATNYVPADVEGKKLKERIVALEGELADLKSQLNVKMQADENYRKAKARTEADRDDWRSLQETKENLQREKSRLAAQIWQLRTMMERAEKEAKAKGEGSTENAP